MTRIYAEKDWIENHLEETGVLSEVPEKLQSYFDAEAYLRDMKHGGDVSFVCVAGSHYAFWA
jgi:antirestriction protein